MSEELVTLAAGELEATFVPGAGMVGTSLRHRGAELLGERGGLAAYTERGSTFGIPFLHPWANRLGDTRYRAAGHEVNIDPGDPHARRDPAGLPIHGLLAASPYWDEEHRDATSLQATLDFGDHAELLAAFPFPHRVSMEVRLSDSALSVTTTVTPTSDRSVPISFGFHPYLVLPGVPRADWRVTVPAAERLVLDDRLIPTGEQRPVSAIEDQPLRDRTFDDGFAELARPEFALAGGGRRIVVRFLEGYSFAQVYAPPDYDTVCFEPMTAPADALRSGRGLQLAEPGDSYRAAFSIEVEEE